MVRRSRLPACLLASLLWLPAAAGAVFKCRMPDGSLAFLDHECPDAAKALDAPKLPSDLPFAWRCGKDEPPPMQGQDALASLPRAQRDAVVGAAYGLAYARAESRIFLDRAGNAHVCASGERGQSELVVTPEGRTWANRGGKVERLGGASRSTRLAACSSRITGCYQPNVRSLDQCANEAPICTTSEPVEGEPACCAEPCIARYRELRAQDMDPMSALDQALFSNEACSGVKRGD